MWVKTLSRHLDKMPTIYLLTEDGHNHGAFDVLSWSADKQALEAEALRLEWERYERLAAQESRKGYVIHNPDQTDYRCFKVEVVEQFRSA